MGEPTAPKDAEMTDFPLNPSMCIKPARLTPSAWIGHIPFAAWIVQEAAPRLFVELGTHHGASYLSFCQAVKENRLGTACFAVDTWQGDEHAGNYGDEVFEALFEYHQVHYAGFSQLLRMTFDEAASCFDDGSVDLLHIDGLHTYEAVKHDFETWLPKMSEGGVVLFHDTMVRERNFGVWRLWEELTAGYPHFEFNHAHGLGVLLVGSQMPAALLKLAEAAGDEGATQSIRRLFERLAQAVEAESTRDALKVSVADLARDADHHLDMLGQQSEIIRQRDLQLVELHVKVGDRDEKVAELHGAVAKRDRKVEELSAQVDHLDRQAVELRDQLQARDRKLVELHGLVGERDRKIEAISNRMEEVDAHLARQAHSLSAQVVELESATAALRSELGDVSSSVPVPAARTAQDNALPLMQELSFIESRVRYRAAELSKSRGRIAELMQRMANIESSLGDCMRQLECSQGNEQRLEDEIKRKNANLQELLDSTSWRWTSPLRSVSAFLTGMRRG
jgi:predicted  nucleic acid-binding Zn-ribbon protein